MLLTKDSLERALMARLMDPPDPYPQWPVAYLCVAALLVHWVHESAFLPSSLDKE